MLVRRLTACCLRSGVHEASADGTARAMLVCPPTPPATRDVAYRVQPLEGRDAAAGRRMGGAAN